MHLSGAPVGKNLLIDSVRDLERFLGVAHFICDSILRTVYLEYSVLLLRTHENSGSDDLFQ